MWIIKNMEDLENEEAPFVFYNDTTEYPLGKHKWTFVGDSCLGETSETKFVQVNVHVFNNNMILLSKRNVWILKKTILYVVYSTL